MMSYQPHDEKTVGLSYENATIRAAYLTTQKGNTVVAKLLELIATTPPIEGVKPLYTDADELQLKELTNNHLTISGLSGSEVLVRRLRLKLIRDKDIEETFAFQAEPLLPFPIDQAVLDKLVVEKQEGTTLLTFLAAKKDYLQKHIFFWEELGVDPEVVVADPIALSAYANRCFEKTAAQFVIHIGKMSSLCILLREGKLLASHTISHGWDFLYQALVNDRKDKAANAAELFAIDLQSSDLSKMPHLKAALDEFIRAIQWNYLAQIKETRLKETPQLCLGGEGANLNQIGSLIAKELEIERAPFIPFDPNLAESDYHTFTLPIGLALAGQPDFKTPINFRQQEFVYSTPWKRFQKSLYLYGAMSLALAVALYIFGLSYYAYREDLLKQRYLSLLSLVQKPYDTFEKQYETKYPTGREGLMPIQDLSVGGLNLRLDTLEKEIRAMPDTFPLLPNTPRVSDVLAFISTHPTLTCPEGTKEECPTFTIDLFHYTMVKRPEFNKKGEKYQVKMELEFTTSSPRVAREFHDALIAPNDFVDPKAEVKWNATKGKYRTSFYLKDKTHYSAPLKEM